MQENPIPAIENAELMAQQTVKKANEDKISLIRNAQEEAGRDIAVAIQKARAESEGMIQTAEQAVRADVAARDAEFEKEKAGIIQKAEASENAAVSAVIEIISGKTS